MAEDLKDRGGLDLTETFIDGTFSSAKKGVQKSEKPKKARGPRSWQLRTAQVYLSPYALRVLHRMRYAWLKTHLKTDLPDSVLIKQSAITPMTVIRLMNEWAKRFQTKLIVPHKTNRVAKNTQDGRELRRYRLRWKVKRLFAWLHNFRRIVTRWETKAENYLGMIELGCMKILLSAFLRPLLSTYPESIRQLLSLTSTNII